MNNAILKEANAPRFYREEKLNWNVRGLLQTADGRIIRTISVGTFHDVVEKDYEMTYNFLLKSKQLWITNTRFFDDTPLVIVMNKRHS